MTTANHARHGVGRTIRSLGFPLSSALLLGLLAVPLAAQTADTSATFVVRNQVNRTYKVKLTFDGKSETVTLSNGQNHTFSFTAHGENCVDQDVDFEFLYSSGGVVVNRVDASGKLPLVAQEADTGDDNDVPWCTLLVRKVTNISLRDGNSETIQWTKLEPSKGRLTFAVRYGE